MKLVKIANEPSLVKDIENKAVLNIDNKGLQAYKNRRNMIKAQQEEINEIKTQINTLESKVDLLLKILTKNGTSNN